MDWQAVAREKQAERFERIPQAWRIDASRYQDQRNVLDVPRGCGILNAKEIEITEKYDAVGIVRAIRTKELSAEEITVAFCKRAAIAQQLVNCLTEIMFEDAIQQAKELDLYQKQYGVKGPLHGLPVSMKDSFKIKGYDATIGMLHFTNNPATEDSILISTLRSLGAILYCKTNVPQTMMTADSENNIWGRTLNPNNKSLTSGGSTGGEGALIAMRGSIAGFGTDIAGSIRIPALCCGIYGFKPTSSRLPFGGQQNPVAPGTTGIVPTTGPMATSVRSCQMLMEAVMKTEPWNYDPYSLAIPWRTTSTKGKLRIGLMISDTMRTPTWPIQKAMAHAAEKLTRAGHDIVKVDPPDMLGTMEDTWKLFALDGNQYITEILKGDPLVPSVQATGLIVSLDQTTMSDYFKLNASRINRTIQWFKLWRDLNIDCILCPGAPHTAMPFNEYKSIGYTATWNYLDYPAGVIVVGKIQESDIAKQVETLDEEDEKYLNLCTHALGMRLMGLDAGPEDYWDAPIALQVVGQHAKDEETLAMMQVIDNAVNGSI